MSFTFLSLFVFLVSRFARSRMSDGHGRLCPVVEPSQEVVVSTQQAAERRRTAERVDRDSARAQVGRDRTFLRARSRRQALFRTTRNERRG